MSADNHAYTDFSGRWRIVRIWDTADQRDVGPFAGGTIILGFHPDGEGYMLTLAVPYGT